jgi:hypothetical protein
MGFFMKKGTLALAVGATLALGSSIAQAQTGPVSTAYKIPEYKAPDDENGPRRLPLADGVTLSPYFNLSFGRDDNLFSSNANKKSSDLAIYNPGFLLEAKGESSQLRFGYDLKSGKYGSSSADDYTDYKIFGSGDFVVTSSMGFRIGADSSRGHDPRGSTDRGFAASPDEYRVNGGNALFAYGANDATGRIELEAGTLDRRYLNNRATTTVSDRSTDNFAGRFFFKVAPKTSLLVEARQDKLDYKLSTSLQDSKETRFLVGVTWDATAATSGTIKIGQIKKDFSAASRTDYSGTGWEGSVAWKPLSYSKVDLFTTKSFSESTGVGNFLLSKRYGATWIHGWDSRLTSTLSVSRNDDSFSGSSRSDTTDTYGFKVDYKLMRWLTIGGEYNSTKRDSNVPSVGFKRNMYMLTVGATL